MLGRHRHHGGGGWGGGWGGGYGWGGPLVWPYPVQTGLTLSEEEWAAYQEYLKEKRKKEERTHGLFGMGAANPSGVNTKLVVSVALVVGVLLILRKVGK